MRPFVLLSLAFLCSIALIWRATGPAPDGEPRPPVAPAGAGVARGADRGRAPGGPPASAGESAEPAPRQPAPPAASLPGRPAPRATGAPGRAAHRLLRRQQIQQILAARRQAAEGGMAGGSLGLPPAERAAMEAAGLDWRRLEQALAGSRAGGDGAAGEEVAP